MNIEVEVGDRPVLRQLILGKLTDLIVVKTDKNVNWISVSFFDDRNNIAGGLIGLTIGSWFSIDLFWLPEIHRSIGNGGAILNTAELKAQEHGCRGAYVSTTNPRAKTFYERHGYKLCLELDNIMPTVTQFTLQRYF